MVDKGVAIGGACCCVTIIAIISAILLGGSYADVDYHYVGILKNTINKEVNTKEIYMPGKYYVGLSAKFIDFETKWKWIIFADEDGDSLKIQAKTKNPSEIYMDIAILYRIREEYAAEIYKKWPTKRYHKDYILMAKNAIQIVPENYSNNDFFTKKEEITSVMADSVNQVFKENFAEVIALIITDI